MQHIHFLNTYPASWLVHNQTEIYFFLKMNQSRGRVHVWDKCTSIRDGWLWISTIFSRTLKSDIFRVNPEIDSTSQVPSRCKMPSDWLMRHFQKWNHSTFISEPSHGALGQENQPDTKTKLNRLTFNCQNAQFKMVRCQQIEFCKKTYTQVETLSGRQSSRLF